MKTKKNISKVVILAGGWVLEFQSTPKQYQNL